MNTDTGKYPRTVEVHVLFKNIGTIDVLKESFEAEIHIESKWNETNEITAYDKNKMWNPQFFIQNATSIAKEDTKHFVNTENSGIKIITELKIIKGNFWEKIELNNFPFDTQELSVEIASKLDKNEINLIVNENKKSNIDYYATDSFAEQQKWNLYKFVDVSDEKEDFKQEEFMKSHKPHLFATITVSRKAGFYISNAFSLILLINSMSLAIFSIDCKAVGNRLSVTLALLLTSIILKQTTNRNIPPVSYLTALDKYSLISIAYLCIEAIWHALVGSFWAKPNAIDIDKWVFIAFSSSYLLFNLFFLVWIIIYRLKLKKYSVKEKNFLESLDI